MENLDAWDSLAIAEGFDPWFVFVGVPLFALAMWLYFRYVQ